MSAPDSSHVRHREAIISQRSGHSHNSFTFPTSIRVATLYDNGVVIEKTVTKTANYLGNLQKKRIFAHYLAAKKPSRRCGAMPERGFTGRFGCD